MKPENLFRFSIELDPRLLEKLGAVQRVCLAATLAIAATVLTAWFVPSLGRSLPAGWDVMKANTALLALCSVLSLICSQPRRSQNMVTVGRLIAVFIGLVGTATLLEYATGANLRIDALLPIDPLNGPVGRMSPQTAFSFALLSVVLFLLRERKWIGSVVADIFLCGFCVMVLVIASGRCGCLASPATPARRRRR